MLGGEDELANLALLRELYEAAVSDAAVRREREAEADKHKSPFTRLAERREKNGPGALTLDVGTGKRRMTAVTAAAIAATREKHEEARRSPSRARTAARAVQTVEEMTEEGLDAMDLVRVLQVSPRCGGCSQRDRSRVPPVTWHGISYSLRVAPDV